ncbi:response regulator transcription factor [Aggregatilinea lenta]|uniref:response regulator transcription factor n=1 Tax=Aggregatilinea lenta TaxID=913108 RepID=UPI0013C2B7EE|nr:response regulator transcription factor [Aggregatilinea lenta]
MTHILMIEDDPLILGPTVRALTAQGFHVSQAMDGAAGVQHAIDDKPDLIILDILLPNLDGWEVCKAIRQRSTVPILMLTALSDEIDRILGLELGADDYLTKPFSMRELLARIKALLRRVEMDLQQGRQTDRVQVRDLVLDLGMRQVTKNGVELSLRYKEFELLSLLMFHAGQAVSRAEIFDQVWGTDWLGDMRTLDVHIRWLREKLEEDPSAPELIQTVRGVGYRFTAT